MKEIIMILLLGFVFTITYAQEDNPLKQGMSNTVTLSNGEEVYDLAGEWAVSIEHSGAWERHGVYPDIIEIKQKGASFVGVTLLGFTVEDITRIPKGSKMIKGELYKRGFKEVKIISFYIGALYSNGRITDNGNKIIIDYDNLLKLTMIRRQ